MSMVTLNNYQDWKDCITKKCGIPLTKSYVAQRLEDLRDANSFSTQKFVETWGEGHRLQIIRWFEQAERELG